MTDSDSPSQNQLVPEEAADFMVVAQNPEEMRAAKVKTLAWVQTRVDEARAELHGAELALESARKNKWKLEGFKRQVSEPKRKLEFYEKMHAALDAGYVIVPNFPIDIFAIRTKRETPLGPARDSAWWSHKQHSERPALGQGLYVDADPSVAHEKYTETNKEGKELTKHSYYPVEFLPVDFPLKMVAPQVLDATGRAMALKAFDEIGILPSRRQKRVDPMVIGQIVYKPTGKKAEKRVSFLVAWWLTEADLRI